MFNYLIHHGIKGQSWGVRNGPPYPLNPKRSTKSKALDNIRLTNKQKKFLLASAAVLGVAGGCYAAYRMGFVTDIKLAMIKGEQLKNEALEKMAINNLKRQQIILKEGSELKRAVKEGSTTLESGHPLYTSIDDMDAFNYRTNVRTGKGASAQEELTLKVIKEIRAPSYNKANKIFDEFIKKNPKYINELEQDVINFQIKRLKNPTEEEISKIISNVSSQMRDSKGLFLTAHENIISKSESSKKLISEYMRKGYNAVEDYYDKGSVSKYPLIVLDPKSTLVETGRVSVASLKDTYDSELISEYFKDVSFIKNIFK